MDKQQLPDFSQIMKIAQQVASQIEPPSELKSGKKLSEKEMTNAISKITKSVTDVVNPEMLSGAISSKKQGKMKMPPTPIPEEESKISLDAESDKHEKSDKPIKEIRDNLIKEIKKEKMKRIVEIDSDDSDDNDPIAPRTKDLHFTLNFLICFSTSSKSFFVLLIIMRLQPASANAIAQALPNPLPAPETKAVLFFRLYFFKYIFISISLNQYKSIQLRLLVSRLNLTN